MLNHLPIPGLLGLQREHDSDADVARYLHERLTEETVVRRVMERERDEWRQYHANVLDTLRKEITRRHKDSDEGSKALCLLQDQRDRAEQVLTYVLKEWIDPSVIQDLQQDISKLLGEEAKALVRQLTDTEVTP